MVRSFVSTAAQSCYTRVALPPWRDGEAKAAMLVLHPKVVMANSFPLGEGGREPVKALVEAVARCGTACLDIPLPVAQAVQAQLVRHLCR